MPADLTLDMLAWVGYAFAGLLIVRLVTAPYFIWKDDQAKLSGLEARLSEPDQKVREHLAGALADSRLKLADGLSEFHRFLGNYEAEPDHKVQAMSTFQRQLQPLGPLRDRFMGDAEFASIWDAHFRCAFAWFFQIPIRKEFEQHGDFLVAMLRNDSAEMDSAYRALVDWLLANRVAQPETQSPQSRPA